MNDQGGLMPGLIRSIITLATVIVTVTLIGVAALRVLGLLALSNVTPIPNSAVNPPLYPGAEQVKVTEQPLYYAEPGAFYYKEIEYEVAAQPEEVQGFYREA